MKLVSAQEVIEFHDRQIAAFGGVPGMPDPGRADAIIHRVLNMHYYQGITEIFDLAGVYLVAIARGHIFNDANKRTALFVAQIFLLRNGIRLQGVESEGMLLDLAVNAATGKLDYKEVAIRLRLLEKGA
ncbi:type II toxin-antitoxin system death-on-curing family toxin [Escherichia coli]